MFIEPFSLKTSQSNLIDDLDSVVAAMSYFPHVRPASQVVDFICLFVASTAVKVLKSVRLKFALICYSERLLLFQELTQAIYIQLWLLEVKREDDGGVCFLLSEAGI